MKTRNLFFKAAIFLSVIIFQNCTKDDGKTNDESNILPTSFRVDIPDAISHANIGSYKKSSGDTLNGNEIYEHLANFIHIGESAAKIVEDIIIAIAVYELNKPMSFSYEGDDGSTKNLNIIEEVTYEGTEWEYEMTISDAGSENNADGGKGIQIFWNKNPIKGISILKPANIDINDTSDFGNAMFKIEYSEEEFNGYEAHMIVSISDIPISSPVVDSFAVKALKMFVGKKGDFIDVYGNSDHPNAAFFSTQTGFDWAFVASGLESSDIGVAEVGLPPNTLDETSRSELLETYSIKNVLTNEINEVWPGIDSTSVQAYLFNTDAPGYFDTDGFIQGGTSPGNDWNDISARLSNLTPYNPLDISNLSISFKD